jgi:hypothetical protein
VVRTKSEVAHPLTTDSYNTEIFIITTAHRELWLYLVRQQTVRHRAVSRGRRSDPHVHHSTSAVRDHKYGPWHVLRRPCFGRFRWCNTRHVFRLRKSDVNHRLFKCGWRISDHGFGLSYGCRRRINSASDCAKKSSVRGGRAEIKPRPCAWHMPYHAHMHALSQSQTGHGAGESSHCDGAELDPRVRRDGERGDMRVQ